VSTGGGRQSRPHPEDGTDAGCQASTVPAPSWPLATLLAAAGVEVTQLPHLVRVSSTAVQRADVEGLSDGQADRWACRLGWHPGAIWADWFNESAVRAAIAERVIAPKGRGSVTPWRSGFRVRIYVGKDHASRSRYLEGCATTLEEAEKLRRDLLRHAGARGSV
jgi:hypothetical protein